MKLKETETKIPYFKWKMKGYWDESKTELFMAIGPICRKIGISRSAQSRKITQDPRFNPAHMNQVGSDGKVRRTLCLPSKEIGAWLNSINTAKVKGSSKPALLRFQREIMSVIESYMAGTLEAEVIKKKKTYTIMGKETPKLTLVA